MRKSEAVIGASDHIGWAEIVTLGIEGAAPVLLDRRRVELVDPGLPSAPYHHEALELDLAAATDLVDRVRHSVAEHASAAIALLRESHRAGTLVVPASPYERLPDSLEAVLRSRALTCAADGMMYREALADAAARAGLQVLRLPRKKDPVALAAEALGVPRASVSALVATLGQRLGPPWRKDHKSATAAALFALAPRLRG